MLPATAVGADITLYLKPGHENLPQTYGEDRRQDSDLFLRQFRAFAQRRTWRWWRSTDDTVGGYSAPGLVALASRGFTSAGERELLAHEISHQWWRCLVSPASADDAFLDEGLATYSAALCV